MEGDRETEMVKHDLENACHSHSSEHETPPPFLAQRPRGGWRSVFYILGNAQERFRILQFINHRHAFSMGVLDGFLNAILILFFLWLVLVW